jgi:hypothetical protein
MKYNFWNFYQEGRQIGIALSSVLNKLFYSFLQIRLQFS